MTRPTYVQSLITERLWGPEWWTPEAVRLRVRYYLAYTVPSLRRQSVHCQPWLDCLPGTEAEVKACLPALEAAGVLVTFDQGDREAAGCEKAGHTEVNVFRMDTDDVLAPQALEVLLASQGDFPAALLTDGYAWYETDRRLYTIEFDTPNFQALRKQIVQGVFSPRWRDPHTIFRAMWRPVLVPGRHYCHLRRPGQCSEAYARDWRPAPEFEVGPERYQNIVRLFGLETHPLDYWAQQKNEEVLRFLA